MSTVTSGTVVVDTSVIPYIRKSDVEFDADSLKPFRRAYFFFDETLVDNFVQRPSEILLNTGATSAATLAYGGVTRGDGFFNENNGAFFKIVGKNSGNTIYINENFLTLYMDGTALSYNIGDLVYQNGTTAAGGGAASNTFLGRVEYFNTDNDWLVVSVLNGTVNTVSNVTFTVGGGSTGNVASVLGQANTTRFSTAQLCKRTSDLASINVQSYTMYSGLLNVIDGDLTHLVLPSNVSSQITNGVTPIKITGGAGLYQTRVINGVATSNTVTFTSGSGVSLSTGIDGTSRFSIGTSAVDAYGKLCGIFNIPETEQYKFKTGERLFTISDSSNYYETDTQMKATARYIAFGLLNTTQEIRLTPIPPPPPPPRTTTFRRRRDPVAQTFFTPKPITDKVDHGMFISSVDLFFKSKPAAGSPQLPVEVRLVNTVNGFPGNTVYSTAVVQAGSVNVSDGENSVPSSSNTSTVTKFTFSDPVYLQPDSEYALVVYSDSPEYEVWISELGQTIIGTDRRVSEQPYAGSFFRSQNASAWTPYQNQDLMFVINRAVFTDSTAVLNYKVIAPAVNVNMDQLIVHSSELVLPNTTIGYFANATIAATGVKETGSFQVFPNQLLNFGDDLKQSAAGSNRRRVITAGNSASMNVQIRMTSTDNTVSPIFNTERISLLGIENLINNGELNASDITITNGGQHLNVENVTVTFSAPDLPGGVTATGYVDSANLIATNIVSILMTNVGSGYTVSPTITISEPGAASNATAVIVSENKTSGGNAKARYITRVIELADNFDAGDLRVYLNAVKPAGTHIGVYYKVLSSTDPETIYDKKWRKMELLKDEISVDQVQRVKLNYKPDLYSGKLVYIDEDDNIQYPLGGKFKYFAVKIALFAQDSTVPPYVTGLRVIASPAG